MRKKGREIITDERCIVYNRIGNKVAPVTYIAEHAPRASSHKGRRNVTSLLESVPANSKKICKHCGASLIKKKSSLYIENGTQTYDRPYIVKADILNCGPPEELEWTEFTYNYSPKKQLYPQKSVKFGATPVCILHEADRSSDDVDIQGATSKCETTLVETRDNFMDTSATDLNKKKIKSSRKSSGSSKLPGSLRKKRIALPNKCPIRKEFKIVLK